ncbi:xanthine dehydrogenase small subunit [Sinorhizobium sp. BG8]|uniref:xanthine dehydrogenase small subunit n=1 Tax=Sinorhizobium sp. BG8 TaxID=2613773 RepID=UPI00193E1894|nr:xanthine dehydrogenase small subunit [Sinorhizobium sp. BG8]QRM56363.1 xanthine dehydrogenase small subunit [Sinorhizobium sp. BG8]
MSTDDDSIRFILNGEDVVLRHVPPTRTLLDWLRLRRRLTGTKEGCAEGDCGACTVLIGRLLDGELVYEGVNACIRLLGSMNATHVVTVEHLAGKDGTLHPVQQAMADFHGSQCGFCTPGIVMSLYGLWLTNDRPSRAEIERTLQGNLCRCTGYEPIVAAAEAVAAARPSAVFDPIVRTRAEISSKLSALQPQSSIRVSDGDGRIIIPGSVGDLADALADEPNATVIAGSTDVGLWVTKQMRDLNPVIFINHLQELQAIEVSDEGVRIGAGVTYSQAFAALSKAVPALRTLIERIGGEQVRNMGTIGGNIANGSPIGDTPPPLIALGAILTLRSKQGRREIPLESYFIDYGKQDRRSGEFVESVFVPALPSAERFAVYKVSKRRDEDISALCGAFRIAVSDNGTVTKAVICFGGMAGIPKRAANVEAALTGKAWTEETVLAARAQFEKDFSPLTDWRATAEYRLLAAKNLLTRFFLESQGETAQVVRYEVVA